MHLLQLKAVYRCRYVEMTVGLELVFFSGSFSAAVRNDFVVSSHQWSEQGSEPLLSWLLVYVGMSMCHHICPIAETQRPRKSLPWDGRGIMSELLLGGETFAWTDTC